MERPSTNELLVAGAIGLGAFLVYAQLDTGPGPEPTGCLSDTDCDGILDIRDIRPNHSDIPDVDGDGILNASDTNPYIFDTTTTITLVVPSPPEDPTTTTSSTTTSTTQFGCGGLPDMDNDGIADRCDTVNNYLDEDSDHDGTRDVFDLYPYDPTRD